MPRILVVDDSRLSRRFVARPLRRAGHEVREAANGQEGLEMCREFLPDCVVTDVLMPVMDGPTMVAALRQESMVPVIMVSADAQATTRERCAQLGIQAFLDKPIRPQDLLSALAAALSPAPVN